MSDLSDQATTTTEIFYTKGELRPKRSLTLSKLAIALSKAQGQMINADKDAKGNYGNYTTLAGTWDVIRKPLTDNEIAILQRPLIVDGKSTLCSMILHSSGEFIDDCELELKFDTSGRMSGMQAMGSAVTYARRYSLQSITGVAPTDDDDGAGAGNPPDPKPQTQSKQKNDTPKKEGAYVAPKPVDYVMLIGEANIKGKKLGELDLDTLLKIQTGAQLKVSQTPPPKYKAQWAQILFNVGEVVKTLQPKNDPPKPLDHNDKIPEDNLKPESPKSPDSAQTIIGLDLETPDVKGKRLSEIPEASLKAALKEIDAKLKQVPPPPKVGEMFSLQAQIKAFLKSMDVAV